MKDPVTAPRSSHDTRAYVLIDTEPDMAARVIRSLRRRDDVLLADAVNGPHDVIAVVEGRNASAVATTILMNIRKLDGVRDFTVYTVVPLSAVRAPVPE
jgi:DNA-binding Lrp family transcriptional regulator